MFECQFPFGLNIVFECFEIYTFSRDVIILMNSKIKSSSEDVQQINNEMKPKKWTVDRRRDVGFD